MIKTLYGDGTHLVTIHEETRVVQLVDEKGGGVVEMSERAFGEVVLGWTRWRERQAEGIEPQVARPTGIESAEEVNDA
jgi:hypothetical protein